MNIVECIDVSKTYHQGRIEIHALKNIDLSITKGEFVAVARAIVSNPSIVLADEPTANLNSKAGDGLLDMMKQMNQEKNVTFIFSTHD